MEPASDKHATEVELLVQAQEAGERFEALLDASPDGILITDVRGRIEVFSAAAERLFGYPESDMVGHSCVRLIDTGHDGGAETRDAQALLSALSAGSSDTAREFTARHSDGSIVPVELTVGQTRGGDRGAFIIVVRDITRRQRAAADLARSETNLRMAQELAHLGSFDLAYPEDDAPYWSSEVFRILDRDPAEGPLKVQGLLELVHAEDRGRVHRAVLHAARQGGPLRIEHRVLISNGGYRHVETQARFATGDVDGHWRISGTVLDVSDRYRFEEDLRRERDRAESYLDLVGVMVIALDGDGNITLVNRQGVEILGRAEADILGRNFFQLFVGKAERADALSRFNHALGLRESADKTLDQLWLNTGNGRRLIRWRNQHLEEADGRSVGLLCAGEDVTEQHLTENQLKHAEEKLRLTFHHAPIGMATLDIEGNIASVNQALCDMLRYDEPSLLGRPVVEIAHPDDRPTAESLREALLRGDIEYMRQEKRYLRSDGSTMAGVVRYSLVRDLRHRPLMFVVQIVDRTEQMAAELEIRQHRERLGQASRLGTMGEMAAAIAHELNQPLTAISSYAQACQRLMDAGTMKPGEITPILGKVHDQARRAGQVILGLRNFVKRRGISRRPTDLHRVLRDVSMLAELDARAHGIPLHSRVPETLPRVQADPVQLQQVLLNLIRNAVDAMQDGENRDLGIHVTVLADGGDEVAVSVTDAGPGISTKDQGELFKPFFTTKKDGMGMGLSLSRSIVEAHGGSLSFTNNPAGGTIFTMRLPTLPESDR